MKTALLSACVLVFAAASLRAQGSQPLDGAWQFTLQPPDLKFPILGEVVLNGTAGTWKMFPRSNIMLFQNPCSGRSFPLTVLPSEPEVTLSFQVHASDVVQGCPNVKVTLHAVSPNKLVGKTGLGYPIALERE